MSELLLSPLVPFVWPLPATKVAGSAALTELLVEAEAAVGIGVGLYGTMMYRGGRIAFFRSFRKSLRVVVSLSLVL